VQGALARLFADPYGWLDRNASRLTTVKLADDIAAVMVDNQPVMPPLGLTMRLEKDGKWYIVLPTNLPVVSNFMPRTREEWSIIASVIKVVENVTVELTKLARAPHRTRISEMSDADFTQFLQGWLTDAGLKIDLAFDVRGEDIDKEAQRWLDAAEAKKAAEAEAKAEAKRKRKAR